MATDTVKAKIDAMKQRQLTGGELLRGFAGVGMEIADTLITRKNQQLTSNFDSAFTVAADTLKNLDYRSVGTQTYVDSNRDGKPDLDASGNHIMEDVFDVNSEFAEQSLAELVRQAQNPVIEKAYGPEVLDMTLDSLHASLAARYAMADMRQDNIDEMTSLTEKLSTTLKGDPLLSGDENAFENAGNIVRDLGTARDYLELKANSQMAQTHLPQITELTKRYELIGKMQEADLDDTKKGIQADILDKNYPFIKDLFANAGLELEEEEEGVTTFALPEGEEVSIKNYADALDGFKQWQAAVTDEERLNLALMERAGGMQPFTVMRDWMEVGTIDEQAMAKTIGFALFSTEGATNKYLEAIPDPAKRTAMVNNIQEYKDIRATGQYAEEFKDMQTRYNAMLKTEQRGMGLTLADMDQTDASAIRFRADHLNKVIGVYNNEFSKQIIGVPEFAEGTTFNTTKEAKEVHIQVLDTIIQSADKEEWLFGTGASQEEPLLGDFKRATGTGQWIAMKKLVEKYINPETGLPANEDKALEVFDAQGPMPGEGEIRYNTFFAVLQSFAALIKVDPAYTTAKEILK